MRKLKKWSCLLLALLMLPALAACGALVQAAVALLNAQSYQNSSWTLLSGVAALGLFLALLGSRVLLTAVRNGYDLAARSPEGLQGAFRVRDKDCLLYTSPSPRDCS